MSTSTAARSLTGTLHETSLDMPQPLREQMVALCNQQLANTTDLYNQTKQAHWNVKGIHFEELHQLFDKMANAVQEYSDTVAERAVSLGGTALGTTRMAASTTELPEFPADVFVGQEMLRVVVERWAQYAASVRAAIHEADEARDLDTADLFTEISRIADKQLWFAEAHLQA